jgi:hypothetical protein
MLRLGYLPQIHGKITTSDEKLAIKEQQVGSSRAKLLRTGNHHLILFYGFAENVCGSSS